MTAVMEKPGLAKEKPSLTIKRRLNAPPAKVYAAWTEPEIMARWLGPNGTKVARAEGDVRVGGRFHTQLLMENGDEHNVSGVYREVVRNEKLVFTWAWRSTPERESLVTVTFKPDGGGTLLTLKHEQFFDEAARDGHHGGWSEALDKLVQYFA
jgi:uncharacterized protein YndB with AHSA1/START domain